MQRDHVWKRKGLFIWLKIAEMCMCQHTEFLISFSILKNFIHALSLTNVRISACDKNKTKTKQGSASKPHILRQYATNVWTSTNQSYRIRRNLELISLQYLIAELKYFHIVKFVIFVTFLTFNTCAQGTYYQRVLFSNLVFRTWNLEIGK